MSKVEMNNDEMKKCVGSIVDSMFFKEDEGYVVAEKERKLFSKKLEEIIENKGGKEILVSRFNNAIKSFPKGSIELKHVFLVLKEIGSDRMEMGRKRLNQYINMFKKFSPILSELNSEVVVDTKGKLLYILSIIKSREENFLFNAFNRCLFGESRSDEKTKTKMIDFFHNLLRFIFREIENKDDYYKIVNAVKHKIIHESHSGLFDCQRRERLHEICDLLRRYFEYGEFNLNNISIVNKTQVEFKNPLHPKETSLIYDYFYSLRRLMLNVGDMYLVKKNIKFLVFNGCNFMNSMEFEKILKVLQKNNNDILTKYVIDFYRRRKMLNLRNLVIDYIFINDKAHEALIEKNMPPQLFKYKDLHLIFGQEEKNATKKRKNY